MASCWFGLVCGCCTLRRMKVIETHSRNHQYYETEESPQGEFCVLSICVLSMPILLKGLVHF